MTERRLISFTVDGFRFAVPIKAIQEVLTVGSVVPLPGSKRPLEGIMRYRDNAVLPVFSLLDLLGKQHDETGNLIMVMGTEDDPVGFRVKNMGGVLTWGEMDETEVYEGELTAVKAVAGVLKKTGGELILLKVERLFDS